MKIIYTSAYCEKSYIHQLLGENPQRFGHQVQKYHHLLIEGLAKQDNAHIETISAPPITPQNFSKKYVPTQTTIKDNITYHHLPVINFKIIKHLATIAVSFCKMAGIKKDQQICMIGDILNISVCTGALLACKLRKIPTVGIVTDVPIFLGKNKRSSITKFNTKLMNSFDSYVFLTPQMNELINKKNKPFVVIEGQVDIIMQNQQNLLENKYNKKICIYAGTLATIYGIEYLVNAFIKANITNTELHIYGNGDFKEELESLCKKCNNVKYLGIKPNDEIVKEELRASLLINPRPTNMDYTKYSFPSKNMEYMVSGTPVLTTKLPGMPKEYNNYVYLIDDESVEGLAKTLNNILSKQKEELHNFGLQAKNFVLQKKNNVVQSKKIITMMESLLK